MRVGILTGGGDCPGLNAVIRAVVKVGARRFGHEHVGILHGWRGLLEQESIPLGLRDVSGILDRGGTILKSSRTNPLRDPETTQQAIDGFRALGIDALVALGGEDTLGAASRLHTEYGLPIVGVPKTIDNDLSGTDVTFSQVITQNLPTLANGVPTGPRRPGAPANLLTGRVLTQAGEPVARAQVQAMGTQLFTMTDTTGRFYFRDLAPGPYFVRARKVGYEPVVVTATLAAVDSLEASVRLTALLGVNTTRLDTMRVTAEYDRMSRRLKGFEERRTTIRGLFIDRQEVAMRKPQLLSDLLRGRANVTVQRNGVGDTQIFGTRINISTGYCPLALILDGTLINTNGGRMDNFVPIDMVAAIEVYTSGTSVPGQFARPETDCGAVIVWTR